MKNARLFTPGPTAVPSEVLEAQARPLIHHRTETFRRAHLALIDNLRTIMRTRNPVVVLTASGSGAMESVVVNLTAPGETVIVTELGKFSERWREIAKAYGVNVVSIAAEWGNAVAPEQVEAAFAANPGAVMLLTTHSETSTGVLQDVEAFAGIARDHDAMIAVDAITSLACHRVETDGWGLDAVVGGSQKGVMTPPGLSYLSLSPRAVERLSHRRHPVYYFDLKKAVDKAATGDTPWTPAVPLFLAMQRALEMILDEGIDAVVARHAANAGAVRAAVAALGLELFPAGVPSNATTVVVTPRDTAGAITRMMEEEYGVKIAGGQGKLGGKIVRLGHLGFYNATDMYTMISAFGATLRSLGLATSVGPALDAMRDFYAEDSR